ncbi:hypothetical protein ADEAN_000207700 [Angomonas deanei]|uniref:Uncharacterized protein n=1 Tax=Angomonas deanei TaxID=59799 RepID=A0A7G2C4I1_9TRYP|nr:hypothetical protein ADEAN_000207700 [Angomonas deanei]
MSAPESVNFYVTVVCSDSEVDSALCTRMMGAHCAHSSDSNPTLNASVGRDDRIEKIDLAMKLKRGEITIDDILTKPSDEERKSSASESAISAGNLSHTVVSPTNAKKRTASKEKGKKKGRNSVSETARARSVSLDEQKLEQDFIEQHLPSCELISVSKSTPTVEEVRKVHSVFLYELVDQDALVRENNAAALETGVAQSFWKTLAPVLESSPVLSQSTDIAVVWAVPKTEFLSLFRASRNVFLRNIVYLNKTSFVDPTLENTEAATASQKLRELLTQSGGNGAKSTATAAKSGKGAAAANNKGKGASVKSGEVATTVPSTFRPSDLFTGAVDTSILELLFESGQSFADVIERHQMLGVLYKSVDQKQRQCFPTWTQSVFHSSVLGTTAGTEKDPLETLEQPLLSVKQEENLFAEDRKPNNTADSKAAPPAKPDSKKGDSKNSRPQSSQKNAGVVSISVEKEEPTPAVPSVFLKIAPQEKRMLTETVQPRCQIAQCDSVGAGEEEPARTGKKDCGGWEPLWSLVRVSSPDFDEGVLAGSSDFRKACEKTLSPMLLEAGSLVGRYSLWRQDKTVVPLSSGDAAPRSLGRPAAAESTSAPVDLNEIYVNGITETTLRSTVSQSLQQCCKDYVETDAGAKTYHKQKFDVNGGYSILSAVTAMVENTNEVAAQSVPFRLVKLSDTEADGVHTVASITGVQWTQQLEKTDTQTKSGDTRPSTDTCIKEAEEMGVRVEEGEGLSPAPKETSAYDEYPGAVKVSYPPLVRPELQKKGEAVGTPAPLFRPYSIQSAAGVRPAIADNAFSASVVKPSTEPNRTPNDQNETAEASNLLVVIPNHSHKRATEEYYPQEIQWLVQQYVQRFAGHFSLAKHHPDDAHSTVKSTDPKSVLYFQALGKMRELQFADKFGGKSWQDLKDVTAKFLQKALAMQTVDVNHHPLIRAAFMDDSSAFVHGKCTVEDKPKLRADDVFKRCVVPLSNYDDKLQRSVERSFTKREREHVLQQVLLLQLARAAKLFPFPQSSSGAGNALSGSAYFSSTNNVNNATMTITGHNNTTVFTLPVPLCTIEEMITKELAESRVVDFTTRFGHHLCSVLSFEDVSITQDGVTTTNDAGEVLKLTSTYSKSAENIYPSRRAVKFTLAGVTIPNNTTNTAQPISFANSASASTLDATYNPNRQQSRVWMYMIDGIPSLEEFNRWERWLAQVEKNSVKATLQAGGTNKRKSVATINPLTTDHTVQRHKTKAAKTEEVNPTVGNLNADRLADSLYAKLLRSHLNQKQLLYREPRSTGKEPTVTCSPSHFKAEHKEVLYPYCDSVVEVTTTDTSRVCRYIKSCDVVAAFHHTISPKSPETEEPKKEAVAGVDKAVHMNVRFDDGLLFTCSKIMVDTSSKKKAGKGRSSMVVKYEEEEGEEDAKRKKARSLSKSLEQIASAKKRKSSAKNTKPTKKTKEAKAAQNVREEAREKEEEQLQREEACAKKLQQSSAAPPITSHGCINLWNTKQEEVLASGANEEAQLEERKDAIKPLSLSVTTNNFVFEVNDKDSRVWMSYHSLLHDGASSSRHLAHFFSSAETIHAVHFMGNGETLLLPSQEIECRRSVELSDGTVTRYFVSGVSQALFPDGSVLVRYPEDTRMTAVRARLAKSSEETTAEEDTVEKVVYETLTVPSGSRYVRQLQLMEHNSQEPFNEGQRLYWKDYTSLHKFIYLGETHQLDTKCSYNKMHACHNLCRSDGVSMTYYYHKKGASNGDTTREAKSESNLAYTKVHTSKGTTVLGDTRKGASAYEDLSDTEDPILYARVVLHSDGTTIVTFTKDESSDTVGGMNRQNVPVSFRNSNGTGMPSWVNSIVNQSSQSKWISPVLLPLLNDAVTVSGVCGELAQFCVESPRMPRLFLSPSNAYTTTFVPRRGDSAFGGKADALTHCYYAVFGDGTVMAKSLVARPSPAALVAAQRTQNRNTLVSPEDMPMRHRETLLTETTLSRPTDTVVRVVNAANLVIVEPADVSARNKSNAVAATLGEGYPMFDLALGQFRLVDYHSHVAEVFNLLSPVRPVCMRLVPSNWEAILRSLVSPFYTPHRLPAEKEKEMNEQYKKEEAQDDKRRMEGYCPPLLTRLRELTEGFIIEGGLLKPDVFHELFHERHNPKTSSGPHRGEECSTEFHSTYEDVNVDNVFPVMVSELANGEVLQYMTSEKLHQSLRALEALEEDPVFLSRSVASGEPGAQQLSLFRIPSGNGEEEMSTGVAAPFRETHQRRGSGGARGCGPACYSGGYGAIIQQRNDGLSTLSTMFSGITTSAGYSNSAGRSEVALPQSFVKASSRWVPPSLQPPRRFIEGKRNVGGLTVLDGEERHPSGLRMIQETAENKHTLSSMHSGNTYVLLCVFLQFEEVTPAAANVVLQSSINRHSQLKDLSRHHEVMKESFPAPECGPQEDQLRLQEVYHSMRKKHKMEKQRLKEMEQAEEKGVN